jgi:hypothetical protein
MAVIEAVMLGAGLCGVPGSPTALRGLRPLHAAKQVADVSDD